MYTVKYNYDGSLERYKVRFVAKVSVKKKELMIMILFPLLLKWSLFELSWPLKLNKTDHYIKWMYLISFYRVASIRKYTWKSHKDFRNMSRITLYVVCRLQNSCMNWNRHPDSGLLSWLKLWKKVITSRDCSIIHYLIYIKK